MKHRKHNQRLGPNAEIHGKRKTPRNGAPYIAVYDRVTLRCGCRSRNGIIDLADKLLAEARPLFLVPSGCVLKLALRGAPENNT